MKASTKPTQEDIDQNAKLQPESKISSFEQKIIKGAIDIWGLQAVVEFTLMYAQGEMKAILEALEVDA